MPRQPILDGWCIGCSTPAHEDAIGAPQLLPSDGTDFAHAVRVTDGVVGATSACGRMIGSDQVYRSYPWGGWFWEPPCPACLVSAV